MSNETVKRTTYKPGIVARPPWWRWHVFPWGWRQLKNCILEAGGEIWVDGYHYPDDDGRALYRVDPAKQDDGGVI